MGIKPDDGYGHDYMAMRAMHGDAPRLSHSTHITDVIWSEGQDRHMTSPWAEGGEWFQGPGGYTEKIGYKVRKII